MTAARKKYSQMNFVNSKWSILVNQDGYLLNYAAQRQRCKVNKQRKKKRMKAHHRAGNQFPLIRRHRSRNRRLSNCNRRLNVHVVSSYFSFQNPLLLAFLSFFFLQISQLVHAFWISKCTIKLITCLCLLNYWTLKRATHFVFGNVFHFLSG